MVEIMIKIWTKGIGMSEELQYKVKGCPGLRKSILPIWKFWCPEPDEKAYELTFECKAQEPMSKHSGIVTK